MEFSAFNSGVIGILSTQAPAGKSLQIKAIFHQHLYISWRKIHVYTHKTTETTLIMNVNIQKI